MLNPEKQYYGLGGDFIPFSDVDYSNIEDSRVAYRTYFMNEIVYMCESPLPTKEYLAEVDVKSGIIKGKIGRYIAGIGQMELFIIEAENGYQNVFHRGCFTKRDFTKQCELRDKYSQKL